MGRMRVMRSRLFCVVEIAWERAGPHGLALSRKSSLYKMRIQYVRYFHKLDTIFDASNKQLKYKINKPKS